MGLPIPEEIDFDDIAKNKWLFQTYYYTDLDNIVVINNGTGQYFTGKNSINDLVADDRRPLTPKERFTITLLRNFKQ